MGYIKVRLAKMNAQIGDKQWGVGGSQEIMTIPVVVEGNHITVESETFIRNQPDRISIYRGKNYAGCTAGNGRINTAII